MAEFIAWLSRFFSGWKLWIVVPPWEIAVRVRLGRNAVALQPGPHLRLPFLDQIVSVNTRLRITTSPPSTVASDTRGFVRLRRATAGFVIEDPLTAILRFNHPTSAVDSLLQTVARAGIAEFEALAALQKQLGPHGIAVEFVRFVDDAEVRAFRLIQTDWGVTSDGRGEQSLPRQEF